MNSIDKYNYEAYLLDRAEGNLPENLSAELDLFLSENPQLAVDAEGLDDLLLTPEALAFPQKKAIRRSEEDLVSSDMLVAYIERQLDKKETLFVEKSILNNEGLQAELALYQRTVLQADPGIVYPSKSDLKRRNKIIWLNPAYTRYAAAAALLLCMGLVFIWKQNQGTKPASPLANNTAAKHTVPAAALAVKNNPAAVKTIGAPHEHVRETTATHTPPVKQETIKNEALPQPNEAPQQNDPLFANGSMQEKLPQAVNAATVAPQPVDPREAVVSGTVKNTRIITISDEEDEDSGASKKKNVLWAMAGKALKGLNKAGLKTVDGTETDGKKAADYQLTLGGFHVTHSETLD